MDSPLTLSELRNAVGDLSSALLQHRSLSDEQWDRAIATLYTAREQHGGRIRQLIHVILHAGRNDAPAGQLPAALEELHCHLAIADDPPHAPPPPERRRRRRNVVAHAQMRLFDTDHTGIRTGGDADRRGQS